MMPAFNLGDFLAVLGVCCIVFALGGALESRLAARRMRAQKAPACLNMGRLLEGATAGITVGQVVYHYGSGYRLVVAVERTTKWKVVFAGGGYGYADECRALTPREAGRLC